MIAWLEGIGDTVRRVLKIESAPEPEAGPVETPFIKELQRERALSERRRRAHRTVTRDLSRAFAPPVWKQGRG